MLKDSSAAWKTRHRGWLRFVQANIQAVEDGKAIPLGPSAKPLKAPAVKVGKGQPLKVVVCSPHPDDESLVGGLALRLHRECGARVTNCAITLGSNLDQRARRRRELKASCAALGFHLTVANPPWGFDDIHLDNRQNHPEEWAAKVRVLSAVLENERPDVVFAHHAEDQNVTHVATHYLAAEALGDYLERSGRGPLPFIETEFWHQHSRPNLMVGVSPEDEATLLMATAEHGGEVRRNPYHLRHPGRMIDNVRRGAEVVGAPGGPAPDFPFAELYRLVFLSGRNWVAPRPGGRVIAPGEKIDWKDLVRIFWPEELSGRAGEE
jgi:LmbE family N-acetylglucosaminyl deacetylase